MPRRDRTGPGGAGPMTGRGAGFCSGSDAPGFANATSGRFFGRGGGRGGGYRFFNRNLGGWMRDYWPRFFTERSQNPADKIEKIKEEIDYLEKTISGMKSRIEGLKSGNRPNDINTGSRNAGEVR